MPTRRSQVTLNLFCSHKKATYRVGAGWIMNIDPPADLVARLRVSGTRAVRVPQAGMPALMVSPAGQKENGAVILHLHGGGYVSGGLLQCRAVISPICAAAGIPALTFSYRLAPRYPYPAQLEDACQAYRFLRDQGYSPDRIALVGESAGGNLALSLALRLRETGERLPAAIALISPWVDLAQTGDSYRTLRDVDATLDADDILRCAISFAGGEDRLLDPRISPVFADFHGFPPVLIHCGTREILLSDAEKLESAMLRDGVNVHLIRWEGMCHVFQVFGFEESKAANRQIGQFIKTRLQG